MIENVRPKDNGHGEYLLDVLPTTQDHIFSWYNISHYLPRKGMRDREKYEKTITHVIKGATATVNIIDSHGVLTDDDARNIAIKFITNDFIVYRLD